MKAIKIIMVAGLLLILPACTNTPEPIVESEATYTIQELIDEFLTEEGTYFPVRTRANGENGKGFFSVDDIPEEGEGQGSIIIRGRVVSDDRSGNLYKTLVIQDEKHPEQSLRLSVDLGSLSGLYPLGQLIAVRCNGLAIGKYATQPQLCVPAYNNNVDANNASQKVGWAPGRIPGNIFQMAATAIGLPDKAKVVAETMTIDEIISADPKEMEGRLVRIENVFFNQKYADKFGELQLCTDGDPSVDQNVRVFAPTTSFWVSLRDVPLKMKGVNGFWFQRASMLILLICFCRR